MKLSSNGISIDINKTTFGTESIRLDDDTLGVNFCGDITFGLPGTNNFLAEKSFGTDGFVGKYLFLGSDLTCIEHIQKVDDGIKYLYVFENEGKEELQLQKGEINVITSFNNEYDIPEVSLYRRCHSHVRTFGQAYIFNETMNGDYPAVGLALTKGRTFSYIQESGVNRRKRGTVAIDFDVEVLAPGEKYEVEFVLFAYSGKEMFFDKIKQFGILNVTCDNYFPSDGDTITIYADAEKANIDDKSYDFVSGKCSVVVHGAGDKMISIIGENAINVLTVHIQSLSIKDRADLLVSRQIRDGKFVGAFPAYDVEGDKPIIKSGVRSGLNLGGYRIAPLLFLLSNVNHGLLSKEEYSDSIDKALSFVDDNLLVGAKVCDDVCYKRVMLMPKHYTYPLFAMIKHEAFKYNGDMACLMQSASILREYFVSSNGYEVTPVLEVIATLKENEKLNIAEELVEKVVAAADKIISSGNKYALLHGMPYGLSAVCGALATLIDAYVLTQNDYYLINAKEHLRRLDAFSFDAPSYAFDNIPLVFEKDKSSGLVYDYALHFSIVSAASAYYDYYVATSDLAYKEKAGKIVKACATLLEGGGSRGKSATLMLNGRSLSGKEKISAGEDVISYYYNLIFNE